MTSRPAGLSVNAWLASALTFEANGTARHWQRLRPDLADEDGRLNPGVLACAIDGAGGVAGGMAVRPDWVVTVDLELRMLGGVSVGPARCEARCLRGGKRLAVTEVVVHDEGDGDRLAATAIVTCGVLTPDFPIPVLDREPGVVFRHDADPVDPPPFREWLGIREVPAEAPGCLDLPLREELLNPWGMLHGGVSSILAYEAAHEAARAHTGRTVALTDMVARFMQPGRVGPIRAEPRVVGVENGVVQVRTEIRDAGAGDRLMMLINAGFAIL